jgi:hypothetical protein
VSGVRDILDGFPRAGKYMAMVQQHEVSQESKEQDVSCRETDMACRKSVSTSPFSVQSLGR